jgi:hypothetical protein
MKSHVIKIKGKRYRVTNGAIPSLAPIKSKRARKRKTAKAKPVRSNPRPLLFVITAKGSGKRMHYDGTKFSERARVVTFATAQKAHAKALELLGRYPILRKYRIAVEPNFAPPRA